ncbi:MarR family transcriptional regulator [Plantactinospora veratri]|uniref:MarR family transcriptional regulator n=1 Tax=Plantactinospora veratri TaxID=1436122 RepID=A0ABU7SNQ3_9ACTN
MVEGRDELIGGLVEEMPRYISAAVRFQVAVAHQLDMSVSDVHGLAALLETGPAGVRQLADLMGMTTSAVTRLVDRLERGGYVRREPDPADRRRVVIHVVEERVAQVAGYYERLNVRWQRQISQYSDPELRFLLEFLRQGRQDARAETVNLRAGGRQHATRGRRVLRPPSAEPPEGDKGAP